MFLISLTKEEGNSDMSLNEKNFQIRSNKSKIELKNIQDYILVVSGLLVVSKC